MSSKFGGVPVEQGGSRFGGEPVEAPSGAPAPEGGPVEFSAMTMASNIPSSAVKLLGDMWAAATSPDDIAKMIWHLGSDFVRSGDPDFEPTYLNAIAEAVENRYGSADAFKTTAMEDPVGMLADFSGVLMMSRVPKLVKLGQAIEPTNLAAGGIQKAIKGLPNAMYTSTAKWSNRKGMTPARRRELSDTALRYGVTPTEKGMAKLQGVIDGYNAKITDFLRQADASQKPVPIMAVKKSLMKMRRDARKDFKINADADAGVIDAAIKDLDNMATARGKTHLTAEELQAFKVDAWNRVDFEAKAAARAGGSMTPNDKLRSDIYTAQGRDAAAALENLVPNLRETNAELGKLLDLRTELHGPVGRISNRDFMGMDFLVKPGFGAALDLGAGSPGVGTTLGTMAAIAGHPRVKAPMAIGMQRMTTPADRALELLKLVDPKYRVGAAVVGRGVEE